MSYELLKNNINSLLVQKNYKVSKVEELAELKNGNLNNILCGRSKKPSAEILVAIAKVFDVTVEDLLKKDGVKSNKKLTELEINLFTDLVQYLSLQIQTKKISLSYPEFISLIKEMYDYSTQQEEPKLEKHFINWFLAQKYD